MSSSRLVSPGQKPFLQPARKKTPTRGPEAALPGSARPACLLLPLLLGCFRRDVPAAPLTDTSAASQVVEGWRQAVEPKVVGSWSSATAPCGQGGSGVMDRWTDGSMDRWSWKRPRVGWTLHQPLWRHGMASAGSLVNHPTPALLSSRSRHITLPLASSDAEQPDPQGC